MKPRHYADNLQSITCNNANAYQREPEWLCHTDKADVTLVNYVITCEGYDFDDDQYVVDGSCYIVYDVIY